MEKLFQIVAGVSNQWSLAAFAIAAILYVATKRSRGKVPPIAWLCIALMAVIALAPMAASFYIDRARIGDQASAIYRVRVTVLDPRQMPVEDAKVWSSVGGEAKKVTGGWQFDIPAASLPADGGLSVFASVPSAFLTGRNVVQLASDRFPAVTVQLEKDASAAVKGIVIDESGRALAGARVSVVGHETDAVTTADGGNFSLPAHAAEGQQVQLHAEKPSYRPANQWHPAGDAPATIVLERGR